MSPKCKCPPIGMSFWLLGGGRPIDRIEWIIKNGFEGVSLSQTSLGLDRHEKEDIAAAIASARLFVTYHGNVHHKLKESGELDTDFAARMIDDVIWWHANTGGVYSCCSDAIHVTRNDGTKAFAHDLNRQHMDQLAQGVHQYGIRVGIENSFGGQNRFCTIKDFIRFKELCGAIPTGMLLDAAHANIHVRSDGVEHENDIGDYIGRLPLKLWEVHFSDNLGEKDEHKYLGYGNLDLRAAIAAVKHDGFNGMFTVEVCLDILAGKYASDIDDPKQTDMLRRSRERISAVWAALE